MEIKLDLKIFLFAIIFYFTGQIDIYCLCILFALIHEFSHVIVGILMGYKLKSFKVMPLGFSIYFKTNIEDYNKKILKGNLHTLKNLIITLAGPITNIIIFILAFFLPINFVLKSEIIYINALIAIFNLLPIYPLDGERIFKNILKLFYSNSKAHKYINIISNVTLVIFTIFCSIFILYAKNIAIVLILIYLWYLMNFENKIQKARESIYNKINE